MKKDSTSEASVNKEQVTQPVADNDVKRTRKRAAPKVKLPAYIREIYAPLYENAERSHNLDDNRFWSLVTLGYNNILANDVCKEINYQNSVLQLGATFGKQIEKVAAKIGPYGSYDIIDVSETQINRCKNKHIYQYPKINFIHQDATKPIKGKYDVVICYMLLHEVPDPTKRLLINNALKAAKDTGKVIFVDYHQPTKWHPAKYFVRLFNRLYQPFAETLWKEDIRDFAQETTYYSWKKTTFFGGMYQKVVAIKKVDFRSSRIK